MPRDRAPARRGNYWNTLQPTTAPARRMQRTAFARSMALATKVTASTGSSSRSSSSSWSAAKAHEWYERAVERFQRHQRLWMSYTDFRSRRSGTWAPRPGPPGSWAPTGRPRSLRNRHDSRPCAAARRGIAEAPSEKPAAISGWPGIRPYSPPGTIRPDQSDCRNSGSTSASPTPGCATVPYLRAMEPTGPAPFFHSSEPEGIPGRSTAGLECNGRSIGQFDDRAAQTLPTPGTGTVMHQAGSRR